MPTLTEKQWIALSRLTDERRRPSEIGAAWQTLEALCSRGLAAAGWFSASAYDTRKAYRITQAGLMALREREEQGGR